MSLPVDIAPDVLEEVIRPTGDITLNNVIVASTLVVDTIQSSTGGTIVSGGNISADNGIASGNLEVGATDNTISSTIGDIILAPATNGDVNLTPTGTGVINTNTIHHSTYIQLSDMNEPANGADGTGRIYKTTGKNGLYWKPDSAGPSYDLLNYVYTNVNTATYSITATDQIIGVTYTTTGSVTLTLPAITGLKRYIIKDEGGNAKVNNIVVNPTGADTIEGDTSLTINVSRTSITLYNNGTSGWFVE